MASEGSSLDERVYMITAEDENGDHHVFVSMDQGRAEARYEIALKAFRSVKANWLEKHEWSNAANILPPAEHEP